MMPYRWRICGIAMHDWIRLHDLRYQTCHGVLPHERVIPQEFRVDVEIAVNTYQAAQNDDLQYTVNYADVVTTITQVMQGEPMNLIETLAQRLADAILIFPRVVKVGVRVKKMAPPLSHTLRYVEVEIWRDA